MDEGPYAPCFTWMLLLIHALVQIMAYVNHVFKWGPWHIYGRVHHIGFTAEVPSGHLSHFQ